MIAGWTCQNAARPIYKGSGLQYDHFHEDAVVLRLQLVIKEDVESLGCFGAQTGDSVLIYG